MGTASLLVALYPLLWWSTQSPPLPNIDDSLDALEFESTNANSTDISKQQEVTAKPLKPTLVPQETPISEAIKFTPEDSRLQIADQGSISLYFRGSSSAFRIAKVLEKLSEHTDLLRRKDLVVTQGDSICSIVVAEGLPVPCLAYEKTIRKINSRGFDTSKLNVGQVIRFPDIEISKVRVSRLLEEQLDNKSKKILSDRWEHLNPVFVVKNSLRLLYYDSFKLLFQLENQDQLSRLQEVLEKLELEEVSIEVVDFVDTEATTFSRSAAETKTLCENGNLGSNPIDYVSYSFKDSIVKRSTINVTTKPEVYILDVPLQDAPNIAEAPIASEAWNCEWHKFNPQNHSTHMAGIIASRSHEFGFKGVEPEAKILDRPFLSTKLGSEDPVVNEAGLKKYHSLFSNHVHSASLPIFLIASSFKGRNKDQPIAASRYLTSDDRFKGTHSWLAHLIREVKPLLVVAAGQDSNIPGGLELDAKVDFLSPQNLGDLSNVINVSACSPCKRSGSKLQSDANFDIQQRLFVHVAAPGGEPIPGWLNGEGIGQARGTSQAAAFVAGVTASMIGRFPNRYKYAWQVKQRLQTTSWPLINTHNQLAEDSKRISAGIVDPELATLDPSKSWLKTAANGWISVSATGWSHEVPQFEKAGQKSYISFGTILRVMQNDNSYFIYENLKAKDPGTYARGAVRIIEAGRPTEQLVLTTCNSDVTYRIADVKDFVPKFGGLPSTEEEKEEYCH